MKYVQLNHEEFNKIYRLNGAGGSDQSSSTDPSKKGISSSNASPKTPEHQGSSSLESDTKSRSATLVARLEAYRRAYLALTPPDNFDTALYEAVEWSPAPLIPAGSLAPRLSASSFLRGIATSSAQSMAAPSPPFSMELPSAQLRSSTATAMKPPRASRKAKSVEGQREVYRLATSGRSRSESPSS
jgi:hypothetical protein